MIKGVKFVVTLVSYFSYGQTQICINSLRKYCPDCFLLIVDNNPSTKDSPERKRSYFNSYDSHPIGNKLSISHLCDLEKQWIRSLDHAHVIETPYRMDHGLAIDLAMQWCRSHLVEFMVHIEPDCTIYGPHWLNSLLNTMQFGIWMASGCIVESGALHPTPSIWSVRNTHKLSFKVVKKDNDLLSPEYAKICNYQRITYDYHKYYWDTGMKSWYECAKLNKAKYIHVNGLHHTWRSSSINCVLDSNNAKIM